MAKGKKKLNKTNSSGWLDNYSEESVINKYADGDKVKDKTPNKNLQQYFKLPTKRVAVDNTYNKNSPKVDSSDDKEMVNRLLREKANESQKAKEKRIADVRRLEELNQKSMLETANAKDLYDIGEGMKSKYRFSNEDNFFDDYINPFNMVGGMAGGLAQTPELINQGDYTNAALSLATPLTVGALAGIGTQNAGQFLNNALNPLAGAGNLIPSIDKNINKLGLKNYSNISDKLNNTLNNVDYEISTVLKKLDPFYQKKINQELISANQWQNDWYNNFKTRKRIENLSEEINNDKIKTFEGINIRNAAQRNDPEALKDFTQDELNSMFPDIPVPESFPSNDWDKILDRINNKNYLSEFQTRDSKLQKILKGEKRLHEGNDGISGYFLDDTFKGKRQNFVNKYANNVKSTAIHEGNHGLTDGNELIPFKERKNIVKIFGDDAEIPKRNSAREFNTVDEYLQDPTEVYARIMELRKDMGLKPGEILEKDKFFNIMEKGRQGKTPVDSRFFELIKNPNEFKNLFNRLPTAALPIGIGAASQFYNGQEEEINQYPDGGIIDNIKEFFTEKTSKATPKSAPEKSSPKTFKIEDKRKVLATSGNPIRPNVDLTSGEYDLDVLNGIIESAKRNKLSIEDAKNLAAIAFQETKFGKVDENLGHVFDNVESRSDLEALTNAYITKMKEADRLGIKDDATRLQVYNGLGVIKPSTEQGYHGFKMKKIYGVPVPNEGINMKKNPLYGKQIMDLRDNVLNQNPEYVNYLNAAYNSKDPVPVYSDIELKTWGPRPLLGKFQSGGKINAPIYVDNPNDPRLRSYQDSTNAYINSIKTKNKIEKDKYFNFSRDYDVLLEGKGVKLPKDAFNKQKNNFKVYNKGTNKNMSPTDIIQFSGETKKGFAPKEGNFGRMTKNSGVQPSMITLVKNVPIYKKPTQPIIYKKTPPPQNTDFTTPNKEESLVLENYIQSIIEKNIPTQEISVKQDFAQYIQPKGYSRQGTAQERQSESFYDANGKMTGQIIEGQYVPTEYGKFLQSGITEDEYVNQIQEYAKGGKVKDNKGYLISNLDNFTPKKIINSNYITTNNMAFPVEANGVVLYPNTGDYVFPTDKVTEIPIMQNGSSINNDMRKKVKKYPAGGYLDYQEGFKGFGVGPQLYQDNSYFRSIMPDNIENIEEQINQPSVFSGINDILGSVNQGVNQITGLMSQFSQPTAGASNYIPIEQSVANNFTQDTQGGAAGIMGNAPIIQGIPSNTDINWSTKTPLYSAPENKNGGYLRKYQNGGEMDMLPVGSPEYIHKSNVFHENYNPVPRVHFTDDTTPFDMGVNLNDLVNMNGGIINKYQNGGDMSLQGYFNYLTSQNQNRVPSRAFNANTNRASLGALESANANDFLNTKMRKDRQSFEDDKVDWGFMDWAKEPVGYSLGVMSTVPIVGDISKSIVGDSFLTRQKGYAIGKGIGNVTGGAAKVIGGVALTAAGMPQGISMIGQGIGDVGEGVGGTVGTLQAKDALSNYDKSGYVSGNRMVNASQDFGNMMYSASDLFGNVSGGIGMAKNMGGLKGMTGKMKGGKTGMEGFGNFMQNLSGMGGQGSGGFDFSQLAGLIGQDGGYLNNYQEGGMVSMPEDFEIPKFKKGGLTPKKAREILHDKSVHGNPLTDKQRKYFGYISSQKKSSGGWLDEL